MGHERDDRSRPWFGTTASYERATSQPWFTSGAVVGGELHLLPLAVLRDRGVLERTIRHEDESVDP
jgi:hypothetical protein